MQATPIAHGVATSLGIKWEPNEARRDFLGVVGLNPWMGHDSSSRQQMFASHLGQALIVKGATERYFQTGMEREYAHYTFSVKMPTDAVIIKTITRYPPGLGMDSIRMSPQKVVIYEDYATKEVGVVNLSTFSALHPYFGFEYVPTEAGSVTNLQEKQHVKSGTILLDSPAVRKDGGYKFGVECNMAFMTLPATSEDGIIISEDVLDRFTFKMYEKYVVEFGRDSYPLNMFGTPDNYKICPDIGEYVRPDGLLCATRKYNDDWSLSDKPKGGDALLLFDMSVHDTMEMNLPFDVPTYAKPGKGRVIDIKVHHDPMNSTGLTPFGMDKQMRKYDTARREFYHEIFTEWKRLQRQRGAALQLTPEFHSLVKEAISVVGETKERIHKHHRRQPLDDYRIEFVVEYEVTPIDGFKLTDCHGGKGVICKVEKPENMPIDEHGNRADIVMDPNSTVSRMNLGRLYEQYYNAARRDVRRKIAMDLGIELGDRHAEQRAEAIRMNDPQRFDRAWEYLMGFYKIVSPRQHNWFVSGEYRKSASHHLGKILREELYMYLPPDNDPESEQIMHDLQKYYPPLFGPVTYVGNSGLRRTTKVPVMIGSMYVLLLEKTGDDWTAVDSGTTQHFGVLSQMTNANKNRRPTRYSPIRANGEAEVRIYVSYAGWKVTAEILDRNNNPATHKQIVRKLLTADKPTDIYCAVDRTKIPLGQSRPLQMVKHMIQTGGSEFYYVPDKENDWKEPPGFKHDPVVRETDLHGKPAPQPRRAPVPIDPYDELELGLDEDDDIPTAKKALFSR